MLSAKVIVKIIFLILVTACAVISISCGLVLNKRRYKNEKYERLRKLMRIRSICFILMLVFLLVVILIK